MFELKRLHRFVIRSFFVSLAVLGYTLIFSATADAQVTAESLTSPALGESDTGPYMQDVKDAIDRFVARDIEGARVLLVKAKRSQPKLAPPEVMLAQLLIAAGQGQAVRQELERAVKNYPNDPEAYLILGDVAASEGRITDAALLFAKASETAARFTENPKRKQNFQIRGYAGIAAMEEARENWAAAKESLNSWIKLDSKSAAPHQRLSRVLFKLDDKKGAYSELQTAAKVDPKGVSAELIMGNYYQQANEPVQAAKFMEAAAKKGADDLITNLSLAQYYSQSGQLSEAEKYADAALKIDPNNLDAKLARGVVARMQKDYKTAKKWLEAAHTQTPGNAIVTNHLALALLEQSEKADQQRALEFAEINQKLNPNNVEAAATLGWVAYRLGRKADASRAFNAIVQRQGLTPESAYYVAYVLKDQNQAKDAVGLLDKALDNKLTFPYRKEAEALLAELRKTEKEKPVDNLEPDTKK
jgi:tetratricopeptide (TPR) repeat protein